MMLEKDKSYTREELLNNPPKKEHLTYRNSLEVGILEEWQGHAKILEEALEFMNNRIDKLRRMFENGTTWEEVAEFGDKVVEEFEPYQDKIKWKMF